MTRQQDQFEKCVYDPIDLLTNRYRREDLPETSKFLCRPRLKKILGTKQPIAYQSPIGADAVEIPNPYGRTISTMPELPSERHANCFDRDYEPTAGSNINDLWIEPTVAYGSINANTQQRVLEAKQEACLKKFQPRKWKMDIENKMKEEKLEKKVATRMKEFGAGFQLPFVPCERVTRVPLRSTSEVWRHKPHRGGEDETGDKFKLLMSKLHREEIWTQKMMESTSSLKGEGNRIRKKCARQEYLTRPLNTMTSWHTDVLSGWSQLHGYAIPHLQTLPENLTRNKAMADNMWKSMARKRGPLNLKSEKPMTEASEDREVINPEPVLNATDEDNPPPPGNTPLPPPLEEPPAARKSDMPSMASKESVPKKSESAPPQLGEVSGDEEPEESAIEVTESVDADADQELGILEEENADKDGMVEAVRISEEPAEEVEKSEKGKSDDEGSDVETKAGDERGEEEANDGVEESNDGVEESNDGVEESNDGVEESMEEREDSDTEETQQPDQEISPEEVAEQLDNHNNDASEQQSANESQSRSVKITKPGRSGNSRVKQRRSKSRAPF